MTVDSRYEVRLSEREIRRLCARSQVEAYARRYEDKPGLGWSVGMWAFLILGGFAFWGMLVAVIAGAF